MPLLSNILAERQSFVTHLECSMTGERYAADQVHGLSRVGRQRRKLELSVTLLVARGEK